MPDDTAISLQPIRHLLGKTDDRVGAMLLILEEPGITQAELARRFSKESPSMREMLETLQRDGFVAIDRTGTSPTYTVGPEAARLARGLKALLSGPATSDLVGKVLVCTTRARGRKDTRLRNELAASSRSVLTGFGDFRYAGVCDDDPDLVSALQQKIEELGAESGAIRISTFTDGATHP